MRVVCILFMLLSLTCQAFEPEKLNFIEINSPDASPNKVFIGDSGDEIYFNLYYGVEAPGAKEKVVRCDIVNKMLNCSASEEKIFNQKKAGLRDKCQSIVGAGGELFEEGNNLILVRHDNDDNQSLHIFDSLTCKENKVPDLQNYNVGFLGVSNGVMIFQYGFGGSWAGIMQYDLSKKNPPVAIENASGDDRSASFSPVGILVAGSVDNFHCFYMLSGKEFKQNNCLKSEGAEFEPDATAISRNGKYMAVSYYNKKNAKSYLAVYKLFK